MCRICSTAISKAPVDWTVYLYWLQATRVVLSAMIFFLVNRATGLLRLYDSQPGNGTVHNLTAPQPTQGHSRRHANNMSIDNYATVSNLYANLQLWMLIQSPRHMINLYTGWVTCRIRSTAMSKAPVNWTVYLYWLQATRVVLSAMTTVEPSQHMTAVS